MSDFKKSQLPTVGQGKGNDSDGFSKGVIRLNLVLSDSNKEWCPVFNYEALIRQAQIKREGQNEFLWNKNEENGSILPIPEEEEKESLKRITYHLEQKYGGKDNRKRCQTYTQLGEGYDENDSFIDNTEACEELLLDEVQRKHDGYYINCERFDRIINSDLSDHEPEIRTKKKSLKRIADSDDEYCTEETMNKKTKLLPEVKDILEGIANNTCPGNISREIPKKQEIKKSKTVKVLLKEKRLSDVIQKTGEPDVLPSELKKGNEDLKSVSDVIESVINAYHSGNESSRDSYLSVASGFQSDASNIGSETSETLSSATQSTLEDLALQQSDHRSLCNLISFIGSIVSSDSDISNSTINQSIHQQPETPPILPEGISLDIRKIIENLINAAAISKENDKKFFTSEVNALILRLEHSSRSELTPSFRNMIYTHLAYFLPCSKSTLVTRGKKLVLGQGDSEIESVIHKFKSLVEDAVLHNQDGKGSEKVLREASSLICANDGSKDSSNTSPVSKAFIWNDQLRKCLHFIARLKVRQFKITHGRKETLDIYIQNFLSEKILPIWPAGVMSIASLLKHCSEAVYEEAKLCNITMNATVKKMPASPNTDSCVMKSKNIEKSSSDFGQSDLVCNLAVPESKKEACEKMNETNVNKVDWSKVPSKKKKTFTRVVNGHYIMDDNYNTDIGQDSASPNLKTDNTIAKEVHTSPKMCTSRGSPTNPRQKPLLSREKDQKLPKKTNLFDPFSTGDQKCDIEKSNEKLNAVQNEEELGNCAQELISPSEAERRLHEETTAATDILSQLVAEHSISQFVTSCGSDDKVQMQLNEVMQDLVVLNQMSGDTVNAIESNNDVSNPLKIEQTEEVQMQGMASFQEEFYSHIRKGVLQQQIPNLSDGHESIFHDETHNNDGQIVNFNSQAYGNQDL